MNEINNNNLWRKLVDYTFGRLSIEDERAVDDYLDRHEEAAEIADGLLTYCEEQNLRSPQALEKQLATDRAAYRRYQEKLPTPLTPGSRSRRRPLLIGLLILLVIGLIFAYRFWGSGPEDDDEELYDPPIAALAAFHAERVSRVQNAGGSGDLKVWEKYFIEKEYAKMTVEIERMFQNEDPTTLPRPLFYLCAAYLLRETPDDERLRVLLPKLSGSSYVTAMRGLLENNPTTVEERYWPTN